MSYSGKLTSFVSVVEDAYRDSGLDFIDYENAIAWTVELIGLIGTPYVYVDKVTDGVDGSPSYIKVENYRSRMPDDLVVLNAIRRVNVGNGGKITGYCDMIETSNVFHPLEPRSTDGMVVWNPLVNIDEFTPSDENFVHTRVNYELSPDIVGAGGVYEYKIDHGTVFTNFETGYIQISYRGYPIDANNYPLIPDDEKFKAALKYLIISKIDWKNWRINPSPQNKSIFNDSEARRDFYVAAARNKSHIPSLDKMESIKNMWLRSIAKVNEHANGFASLNKQEQRYNYNSRGYTR